MFKKVICSLRFFASCAVSHETKRLNLFEKLTEIVTKLFGGIVAA